MIKTDYYSHERAYTLLKEKGLSSWSSNEDIHTFIDNLDKLIEDKSLYQGKILELGCGAGNILLQLITEKQLQVKAYGVDISPTAIQMAVENANTNNINADFKLGNVLDLKEYSDECFNLIIDGHCFHCIIGEDRILFLNTVKRVLSKEGYLFIATMCGDASSFAKNYNPTTRCCYLDNEIAIRYIGEANDIVNEVQNAGFIIEKWLINKRECDEDQDELIILAKKKD